jgi:hypothetical protein
VATRPTLDAQTLGRSLLGRVVFADRSAELHIENLGAPWTLAAAVSRSFEPVTSEAQAPVWRTAASLRARSLHDLPWPRRLGTLRPLAHGLTANASGEIRTDGLSLGVTATAQRTAWQSLRSGFTRLDLRLSGSHAQPRIDATLHARNVRQAGASLPQVRVSILGSPRSLAVRAYAEDPARRELAVTSRWRADRSGLDDVTLRVRRGAAEIGGRVASVRVSSGGIALRGIALRGSGGGEITGDLQIGQREMQAELHATNLDLRPLSRLLLLAYPLSGKLGGDLQMRGHGARRRGHASLRFRNAGMLVLTGLDGSLRLDVEGDGLQATGTLALRGAEGEGLGDRCRDVFVDATIRGRGRLARGGLLTANAWRGIRARLGFEAGLRDLSCVADVIDTLDPASELPVSELLGSARLSLSLEGPILRPHSTTLRVRTEALTAAVSADDDTAGEDPTLWRSSSLDLQIDATSTSPGRSTLNLRLFPRGRAAKRPSLHLRAQSPRPWWQGAQQTAIALRPIAGGPADPTRVQIHGRTFEIEQLQLRWPRGASWRPHLRLRALHRHPDGTSIYAEYDNVWGAEGSRGLTWRSVPPHTQSEILAILQARGH